jgi:hypothetical protein
MVIQTWARCAVPTLHDYTMMGACLDILKLETLMQKFLLVVLVILLASCATRPPSDTERRALNNPPPGVTAWVDRIYPGVVAWFSQNEVSMLAQGRVLTPKESAAASRAGVKSPEKIRVIALKNFPMPQDAATRSELTALGVGSN